MPSLQTLTADQLKHLREICAQEPQMDPELLDPFDQVELYALCSNNRDEAYQYWLDHKDEPHPGFKRHMSYFLSPKSRTKAYTIPVVYEAEEVDGDRSASSSLSCDGETLGLQMEEDQRMRHWVARLQGFS
jgi:hypothetical protein